jgi:NAD(P)-dependent dehydrogenase (short-subunit alcohol dehydrogenase family)
MEAVQRIKSIVPNADIEFLELDLASFQSVRSAAACFDAESQRLDMLFLNGGIAVSPHAVSKDGYEIQFGTNYMGHAMLTQLLMPKLLSTAKKPGADVRIIVMSSIGHKSFTPVGGFNFGAIKSNMQEQSGMKLYGQAMLAKTLFAYSLAKRYPQLTTSSLHPGTVKTNAWSGEKSNPILATVLRPLIYLTGVSPEEGARMQLWCSVSKHVKSGSYYEPIGKAGREGLLSRNDEMADKLWDWTTEELRKYAGFGWPEE